MRKLVRQLMTAMVCGLGLMGTAIAQSSTATLESQLSVDGKLWVVTKGSLQDFTPKGDKVVADFDYEKEAKAAADRLNDALKGGDEYRWLYQYHKRPKPAGGDDFEPFPGKPRPAFEKPALRTVDPGPLKRTVDPGPLKKTEKEVPSIKGKRGKGKIGNASVTFDFRDDKNRTLIISGDMEGTGTWEQTGSALRMTTEVSTFRGTIDGDKASGLRFLIKGDSGPPVEWSVGLGQTYSVEHRFYRPYHRLQNPDLEGWGSWLRVTYWAGYEGSCPFPELGFSRIGG